MNKITKVLIANRGEIAIRIVKATKLLGIKCVTIYSDEDYNSAHRFLSDESYPLSSGTLGETYLNIDRIIQIAKSSNCEAIHPGYGFLAENHEFAKECRKNNIIFIGPSSEIIEQMGNKAVAREFVKNTGVKVISGIEGSVEKIIQNKNIPEYPLLVKAAAGGGGKGMRIVQKNSELEPALTACSREAENYFGDRTVFVEKYLQNPRHIEVQLLGDSFGNVIHLFERECSIQRRYQKIIEESPAAILSSSTREKICNDAVKIAKASNYENAGTIEFLLDENEEYYFLEMNTRVQVEHPVTEVVTGIDIVVEQIKIADGQKLSYMQSDITQNGHAIECRIYAEDSENNFLPSPGKINFYQEPPNNFVRIDSSIVEASEIKSSFDPMISKIIVHDKDRNSSIQSMIAALDNYHIHGIKTNIKFLKSILADKNFKKNKISTNFCENEFLPSYKLIEPNIDDKNYLILAGLLYSLNEKRISKNIWEQIGYWRSISRVPIKFNCVQNIIQVAKQKSNLYSIQVEDNLFSVEIESLEKNTIKFLVNKQPKEFVVSKNSEGKYYVSYHGEVFLFERKDLLNENYKSSTSSNSGDENVLKSIMPGKVIKILAEEGQNVVKGDEVIIIESMKMENSYFAKSDSIIESINVRVGENITSESELITFRKENDEK